jgi:CRISPR-associated protein Cas1
LRVKTQKITLNEFGSFLGAQEGCLLVRDKQKNVQKYPLFENQVGEIRIKMGNSVSSTALSQCALWGIGVFITSRRGHPIAYLRAIDDDSHVQTRISQYEALANGKGMEIAKQIIYGKAQGQNELLKKYGLKQHDITKINEQIDDINSPEIKQVRRKLLPIEGHFTDRYFQAIWPLFPKVVREAAGQRMTWKAYDIANNLFNLSYTFLKLRVMSAVIKSKLEPYLGFVHSEQFGKPSLVCDIVEIYRYLVDDFLLQFTKNLRKRDFEFKEENLSSNKKGKREYLKKPLADKLMQDLNDYFERKVDIARIKHGQKQEIESLICEEAGLLAKYLRGETSQWLPRVPKLVA